MVIEQGGILGESGRGKNMKKNIYFEVDCCGRGGAAKLIEIMGDLWLSIRWVSENSQK